MPRKRFTYRAQGPVNIEEHRAHWADFTFTSGPYQVILKGPWGEPQVWASSEAEGKRVIRHAALIAGIDETHPDAEWLVRKTKDTRIGKEYPVRTALIEVCCPWVTSREGPSGIPF